MVHMYTCILTHVHVHVNVDKPSPTGHSAMKQYVPKKPIRQGFKVWVVADGMNGFFMDMEVYVGRPSDGDTTEHGPGKRVVLQLTEEFCNVSHWVFFTSPGLFDELLSHSIYACGTVKCDRWEFPQQL